VYNFVIFFWTKLHQSHCALFVQDNFDGWVIIIVYCPPLPDCFSPLLRMSLRKTVDCWSFSSWLQLLLLSLTTASVSLLVVPPSAQSAHHWSRNFALFDKIDVASSWTVAAATVSWGAWKSYDSVVFDKKIWVMGGEPSAAVNNDIWYFCDEITWSQANAAASTRPYRVSVMFNHKIWMIRGNLNENGVSTTNVVKYSCDGVAWIQATATTAWPGRLQNIGVVLDSKMWVSRGVNTGTLYSDVWCSSCGITWNQAITAANCAAHGGNKNTIPWCLAYAMALFSVILLQLTILLVCLFFRLIRNQKDSVSALFAQHEQTSSALNTATRGMHDQRSTSRRRRTNVCPRHLHCGHSLAFISLLLTCASSQQMTAYSFSSAYSPQHTSRALAGTSGMN
jgi:hypothetical protein